MAKKRGRHRRAGGVPHPAAAARPPSARAEIAVEKTLTAKVEAGLPESLARARELHDAAHYDEAEALLVETQRRFPDDPGSWIEHAWIAHRRGQWAEAARRSAVLRERFPGE